MLPTRIDIQRCGVVTKPDLSDLLAQAQKADGPLIPPPLNPDLGGVDPLGLRQLNFDMMDEVLPGLNNVARHVRPFVVVAWASRQAVRIAKGAGRAKVSDDELRDFVDRIEVVYAWSQFLRDRNADLPGRQVLASLLTKTSYRFGGAGWKRRRDLRRDSTSFTAPVSYGPALKALGWISPHPDHPKFLRANSAVEEALDAFEAAIADYLDHPVFSRLGDVTVEADDLREWAQAWSLDEVSPAEQKICIDLLTGAAAPTLRQESLGLLLAAAREAQRIDQSLEVDIETVRTLTCERQLSFTPPAGTEAAVQRWRRLQMRQLFRLTLESLLYWIIWALDDGPLTTRQLVDMFQDECEGWPNQDGAAPWRKTSNAQNPVALMRRIETALRNDYGDDLATALAESLAFCLAEPSAQSPGYQDARLPLSRASREAQAWSGASGPAFLTHVLESWVLAQHVYWAVGRSLGEARGNGSKILRLRVMLDEGGWTQAPGVKLGAVPYPTADRLGTAMSLARECGLLSEIN